MSASCLTELDHLLKDLESAAAAKGGRDKNSNLSQVAFSNNYLLHTDSALQTSNASFPESQVIMATTTANISPAVDQNFDELDILLDDLSQAKFSERVERRSETYHMSDSSFKKKISTTQDTELISEVHVENSFYNMNSSDYRTDELRQSFSDATTASSATEELDALMTNLNSTLKIRRDADEPVPTTTQLDDMLGDLKEDMDKRGIRTARKGVCSECDKPIVGRVIAALGKTFHPEHFTCTSCNQELGTRNFFERDGKPYCEPDYHALFSPRCAACEGPILDRCVSALDQNWHPEHFVCSGCTRPFDGDDDGYHDKDGKAFCRECYFSAFAPRCGGCSGPIAENYISSLDRQWHPACFVCHECGNPFSDGNFFEQDGQAYCETHFHALRGSLCAGCGKAISGRCITAMFRKFHPEHFVCSFCLKQLNKGTFKEREEKPYCHPCFDRLFG